jgi:hypothetical protein
MPTSHSIGESHQTSFRTFSPSPLHGPSLPLGGAVPQTGLGILMNGNNSSSSSTNGGPRNAQSALSHALATLSPDGQQAAQDDIADRERQASALAAAGMVAESVTMSQPFGIQSQGLQAPPLLVSGQTMQDPLPTGNSNIDSINWSLMDLGTSLDDMEMDFATLFDPALEAASMQTEGWPGMFPLSPGSDGGLNTY